MLLILRSVLVKAVTIAFHSGLIDEDLLCEFGGQLLWWQLKERVGDDTKWDFNRYSEVFLPTFYFTRFDDV